MKSIEISSTFVYKHKIICHHCFRVLEKKEPFINIRLFKNDRDRKFNPWLTIRLCQKCVEEMLKKLDKETYNDWLKRKLVKSL